MLPGNNFMKKRQILFLAFTICIVLIGFTVFFAADNKGYIQTVFAGPQTAVLHFFQVFSPSDSKLQKENKTLTLELAKMNLIKADNNSLHDQFLTANPPNKNLLPVQIVGMPSFLPGETFPEEYILHAGKKEKVFMNAPIIYKDNLVGKVIKLEDHFSEVILVSNKDMTFSGKTSGTNAAGIVKGTGNGTVIFDNVLQSDTLKVGDVVVTSGEVDINGKGLPPDLVVGKITSVEKNASSLFQRASIAPLINFNKLADVFVLLSN